MLHHSDVEVGNLRRNAQTVGDEQQRDAEAGLDSLSSSSTCACTETSSARNRFIAPPVLGIERQRTRNCDALSLAAGELVRIAGDGIDGEIDQFEQIAGFRQRVGVRHAVIDGSFGDGLADADARIERTIGILKNDLDSLAVRLQRPARQIGDFSAGQTDAAGGRIDQPDDAATTTDLPDPLSPTMPSVRPGAASARHFGGCDFGTRPKTELA